MSVVETPKTDRPGIRQSLRVVEQVKLPGRKPMPKQPTARMKIINGRPYYYEVENIWDRKEQRCRQKSKYLGKELPKGYRLIK